MADKAPGRLVLLLCLVLLTGCYDIQDIDDRMIVTPIGIDARPADRMAVYFRMPLVHPILGANPGGATQKITRGAIASGVYPAWIDAQEREEHAMFLGQCRSIVFGEEMAKRGVGGVIDFFFRHPMFPPNCSIIVARPSAEAVVNIKWPEIEMHDQNIRLFFENKENPHTPLRLRQLFQEVHDKLEDPAIPLVEPSDGGTAIRLLGMAVLRGDRMVGELDRDEAVILSLLRNHPKHSRIAVSIGTAIPVSFQLLKGKTKIAAAWREDGPVCRITMNLGAALIEAGGINPLDEGGIARIKIRTQDHIRIKTMALLRKLQSLGSDPVRLGHRLRIGAAGRLAPKEWPEIYSRLRFRVSVDLTIDRLGVLK